MRKIVVTEFISLDGVIEAPHEWHFAFWSDDMTKFKNDELAATDALLLGRVTYEAFASVWPGREPAKPEDDPFTHRFNALPKYVVSNTLRQAEWKNSHIIKGDVGPTLTRLKQQPGRDIVVHGSARLSQWLFDNDLVDEYRLLVHPIALGKEQRLFSDATRRILTLAESRPLGKGVVALRYEPLAPGPALSPSVP
jgi:dihydrofolate reductase